MSNFKIDQQLKPINEIFIAAFTYIFFITQRVLSCNENTLLLFDNRNKFLPMK